MKFKDLIASPISSTKTNQQKISLVRLDEQEIADMASRNSQQESSEFLSLHLSPSPPPPSPSPPFFARDGHEGDLKTTPQNTKLTPPVVSLDTLTPQQLTAVKKQLDEEVEHLSGSYSQLAAAQAKFKECLRVVQSGSAGFDSSFTTPLLGPSSPCMHDR